MAIRLSTTAAPGEPANTFGSQHGSQQTRRLDDYVLCSQSWQAGSDNSVSDTT
jgi:hypothetical protein